MKICGIDPSINSTGKCIMELDDDTLAIKSVKFYGYYSVKKWCLSGDNVHIECVGTKYVKNCIMERQRIAYDIMNVDMEDVSLVAFEGYAFGANNNKTRALVQLGEFNGGLKKLFYDQGKGIVIYPPKVVKRFATGSGNSDKAQMSQFFKSEYPHLYPELFESFKQNESPHGDLCDAFWMAETMRWQMMYDIFGSENIDEGMVALLEFKSTKKSTPIIETAFFRKPEE